MSQFAVNFIVDAKHLGEVLAAIQPYKIDSLGFKLVAGTSQNPRAGEKPAWEHVAGMVDATPRPLKYFKDKLLALGFRNGTIYNALTNAVENRQVTKKMIGGKPHYLKRETSK